MIKDKEIIEKYLGVSYRHKGRTLEGLDCWGLIKEVYKDLGFELWDIEEDYDEKWSWKGRNHFIENYYKEWVKVKKPNPFDVVLFSNSKGIANHGGVVLKSGKFIHCCKTGVVVSRLGEPRWQKRIEGFYHLKARDE